MWILPTYNRPEKCAAVLEQIVKLGCSTPGVVFVNGSNRLSYATVPMPHGWVMVTWPQNIGVCHAMNTCYAMFPRQPFYGLICDDEYVYTPGWDTRLSQAAGNMGIAHGNDGWQSGKRQHGYVTWGGGLVRTVGWLSLPGLWHWYHDDVWEQLSRHIPVTFCEEVKCEHKHYLAKKSEKDETYHLGESQAMSDKRVFENWMQTGYNATVERIKNALEIKKAG